MAERGASAAFKTEIVKAKNRPFHFLRFQLYDAIAVATLTYRLTDYVAELSWDDGSGGGPHTWQAAGHLLSIGDIEETSRPRVTHLDVALSGVSQTYLSLFLGGDGSTHSYQFINRPLVVWKAMIDDTGSIISDPIQIYGGLMDHVIFNTDSAAGSCTIAVRVASNWVDFQRRPGRHTNDAEQQAWFPGDRGMEFVQEISNRRIEWGYAAQLLPKDYSR